MSEPDTRRLRASRTAAAVALAGDIAVGVFDAFVAPVLVFIPVASAVCLALVMRYQTVVIRRAERVNRPRPDYAAIARMEREIYGEAFNHDGAPEPVTGLDADVQAVTSAIRDVAVRLAELDALAREEQQR
jgi:hypothetical protein